MAGKMNSIQKDELMNKLKQELLQQNIQQIVMEMTDKCFKKCIYAPTSSISSSEKNCITTCVDRFFESRNLITRSFVAAAQNKDALSANLDFD